MDPLYPGEALPPVTEAKDDYPALDRFSDKYAKQRAENLNCDIEYATDWTLQIDLDSPFLCVAQEQLDLCTSLGLVDYTSVLWHPSRSGNWHGTVYLTEPLSIERRILLQALLGSDPKREALCLAGHLNGQEHPILFFRPRAK
jgi:hypothetical protein